MTTSPTKRWRQVQVIDESWQLEIIDPEFVAVTYKDNSHFDVDGWRPICCVWFSNHIKAKPWKGCMMNPADTRRWDYHSLDNGKKWMEPRALKELA